MMNKILMMVLMIVSISYGQDIKNLEYVSPFHDGLAAIKKGNHWAFIDTKGDLKVPFRKDLVATKHEDGTYPVFNDNRCPIKVKKNGIYYYGYINKVGRIIIPPKYLNASDYFKGKAIVLLLHKDKTNKKNLMGKDIISYSYANVIIDLDGNTQQHLTGYTKTSLLPQYFKNPPEINSKFLNNYLCLVKENNKITIKKIED